MAFGKQNDDNFDPAEHKVDEVLDVLEDADAEEREQILAAEAQGKQRVTVLEAYDVDPDERRDAAGRVLYPWETTPGQ